MSPTPTAPDAAQPDSAMPSHVAPIRLLLGLLQGLALYFLYQTAKERIWPATEALLFAPLLLVVTFIPVLLISGLGHLSRQTLWRWLLVASFILIGLGVHDRWRSIGAPATWDYGRDVGKMAYPSVLLWLFGVVGFYIAHVLVLASAADQRRIARYPTYFDNAWKLLIQIKFSVAFVGVCWLVLWLGAALFKLIELNFLQELLKKSWFFVPVTVFAFACAMHLTDVRPAIVRGIRNLLLVLLSWVLPITVLMIGGFLLSLPFTGLAHLWATKHATALLLSAAAALVILINTAFQNGAVAHEVATVLRWSARLASGLLLPLVLISLYALSLRVGEYGWTSDRIIAACCLLVASCYGVGYAWAATRRHGWLEALAPVNIATTFVLLAVLLALFSPLLDPARISVADQMARLERGEQSADKFDFDYLKFEGQRYGLAALERLKTTTVGQDAALLREKANRALEKKNKWETSHIQPTAPDLHTSLKVWPQGAHVPESFMAQDWSAFKDKWRLPACLTNKKMLCEAYLIDFDGDHQAEVLLIEDSPSAKSVLFAQTPANASWEAMATLNQQLSKCPAWREKLQQGSYHLVAPRFKELDIGGVRIPQTLHNDAQIKCDIPAPKSK